MFPNTTTLQSRLLRVSAYLAVVAVALTAALGWQGSQTHHVADPPIVTDALEPAVGWGAYMLLDSELAGYVVGGGAGGALGYLGAAWGGSAAGTAWLGAKLGLKVGTLAGGAIGAGVGTALGALTPPPVLTQESSTRMALGTWAY